MADENSDMDYPMAICINHCFFVLYYLFLSGLSINVVGFTFLV